MHEENVLPIIGELRLITVETNMFNWQTRVYDGSISVHTVYSKTKNGAKRKAAKWCFDHYTVPKKVEKLKWEEVGL